MLTVTTGCLTIASFQFYNRHISYFDGSSIEIIRNLNELQQLYSVQQHPIESKIIQKQHSNVIPSYTSTVFTVPAVS